MSASPRPNVQAFFDKATHTVSYLVWDPATLQAAIVDPVLDYDPAAARTSTGSADAILGALWERDLKLAWILETHAHADHLTAAHHLHGATGAPVVIGRHIDRVQKTFAPLFDAGDVVTDGSAFDRLVEDGDVLPLGELTISVMHTPGHTPACVSYLVGDALFVGDTLFMPDYGTARADFPGGDARTLYRSIQKLLALPGETRVFVGHDYLPKDGRSDFAWETTVAAEREANIHVGGARSEDAFVAMREARDATLGAPALILPSLQVNIRSGALPPPDPNGQRYLKLPVNAI